MKPSPKRVTFSGLAAKARATKRSRMIDEAVRRLKLWPVTARQILLDADRFGTNAAESVWPGTVKRIRAEFRALCKRK